MSTRKLDFICIGFAKSGTTTLYHILSQHPQIYLSKIKEPVFWNDQIALQRGIEWYLKRYYSEAKLSQIMGEINPQITNSIKHEAVVKRILKKNGKVIFILRNPIERLYSHFFMDLLWGSFSNIHSNRELEDYSRVFDRFVEKSFKQFCDGNCKQIFESDQFAFGNYSYYMNEYSKMFGAENIFVLIFEEFVQNTSDISKRLFEFLGVEKSDKINFNIKCNEGNFLPRNVLCMRLNKIWYYKIWPILCRNINMGQKVDEFMDRKLNWDMRTNGFLLKQTHRKQMSLKSRMRLKKIFAAEIQDVETFVGYSLKGLWY